MSETLIAQLAHGPWPLGERHTSADVLWGYRAKLDHAVQAVPELPLIRACIDRIGARSAVQRARAADAALVAAQEQDSTHHDPAD
ncbi:MAG: hypothetical protein M0Z99_31980 [Betaproteobacteria bacterium]|jgi:glutathione S-transferase|nr:hypothetical protein [Betaproteobacteria bacterium]